MNAIVRPRLTPETEYMLLFRCHIQIYFYLFIYLEYQFGLDLLVVMRVRDYIVCSSKITLCTT